MRWYMKPKVKGRIKVRAMVVILRQASTMPNTVRQADGVECRWRSRSCGLPNAASRIARRGIGAEPRPPLQVWWSDQRRRDGIGALSLCSRQSTSGCTCRQPAQSGSVSALVSPFSQPSGHETEGGFSFGAHIPVSDPWRGLLANRSCRSVSVPRRQALHQDPAPVAFPPALATTFYYFLCIFWCQTCTSMGARGVQSQVPGGRHSGFWALTAK